MPKPLEISIRRALASRNLTATEIAERYGVDLADVLRIEMANAKDLAAWRKLGQGRIAA